jgi:hypothetical protein
MSDLWRNSPTFDDDVVEAIHCRRRSGKSEVRHRKEDTSSVIESATQGIQRVNDLQSEAEAPKSVPKANEDKYGH